MVDRQGYAEVARATIMGVVEDFHVTAQLDSGVMIEVPVTYQIVEPGFRPFEQGKASAEEIQARFDEIVTTAGNRGIALGLESAESVRKLLVQEGLGIDCSNFAFRALQKLHTTLGLTDYEKTIMWQLDQVRHFHETAPFWKHAKDKEKQPRDFTQEELRILASNGVVSIEWIASVFRNDLEFIAGSAHMCSNEASVSVEPKALLPGDFVAFQSASSGKVSHVGVVDEVAQHERSIRVDFWHSWHTRDFGSGLRSDFVIVEQDDEGVNNWRFSHQGLHDPARYSDYDFRRPVAIAEHLDA